MFTFRMPYPLALKLAKKLAHSISKEERRPTLRGFLIHKHQDGNYYAVSTDGHRLTRVQFHGEYESDQGDFPASILPAKALGQIESFKVDRALRNLAEVVVRIDASAQKYQIECGDSLHGGALVPGPFPDYDRVMPKEWEQFKNEYGGNGFNARYLAEVGRAASYDAEAFAYRRRDRAIRVRFQESNPAVITEPDKEVLYLLMPMSA